MYEFTDKETRKKFKETEYGKITNRWLYISLIFTIIFLTLTIVFLFISEVNSNVEIYYYIFETLFTLSMIFSLYFDGKRDGAIEQFKKSKK